MIHYSIDATTWTVDDVISWAKGIGLDQEDTNILKKEKVNGNALINLTYGIAQIIL